jgi:hypothetical protein
LEKLRRVVTGAGGGVVEAMLSVVYTSPALRKYRNSEGFFRSTTIVEA